MRHLLDLPEQDLARHFLKASVHALVTVAAQKGGSAERIILAMALALKQHLQQHTNENPGAVLAASLSEVHDVLDFFLALLDLTAQVRLSALNAVMTSRTGSRLLVQQVVSQSPPLLAKEARARASVVAQASYGSDISKAIDKVRCGKPKDFEEILEQIPVWRDALREGAP